MISTAAYAAAAVTARHVLWIRRPALLPFAVYFTIGMAVTVAIEKWAVAGGTWDYTESMPTIAGIGLSPLLQWLVLPALIILMVRFTAHPAAGAR